MNSVKTRKQVLFDSASANFWDSVETPFTGALVLNMYQQTRRKEAMNTFKIKTEYSLRYVLQIEISMTYTIENNMNKTKRVFYLLMYAKTFQYILKLTI